MSVVRGHRRTRRERAEASRRKILRAARDAFLESGYHATTMGDIATRSGLAVQTVSYYFGTKPRLLNELLTATMHHASGDVGPADRDTWQKARDALDDGPALVDAFVDEVHPVLVAMSGLLDVARIGGLTDPDVQGVRDFHEDWRARDFDQLIDALERVDGLRRDIDRRTALDILLTTLAPDSYRVLASERGWSPEKIDEHMRISLKALLLR